MHVMSLWIRLLLCGAGEAQRKITKIYNRNKLSEFCLKSKGGPGYFDSQFLAILNLLSFVKTGSCPFLANIYKCFILIIR